MATYQSRNATKHGHSRQDPRDPTGNKRLRSPEYRTWLSMKWRCTVGRYHDQGISVCERWANSFTAFLEDMGPKPTAKHQLDRYPNGKGNYEPGNVRWATVAQQQWSKPTTQTPESNLLRAKSVHKSLTDGTNRKQKLTVEDILVIREVEGEVPRSWLAQHYGINVWHVRDIQKRRTWAWVD